MKTLSKILWWFVYALPAVLFFSYHPVISLGSNASMNFELSLPLIWLVLFDLGAFVLLIMLGCAQQKTVIPKPTARSTRAAQAQSAKPVHRCPKLPSLRRALADPTRHLPGLSDRKFFLLALFPLYLTLSVFWSDNPLRGLLTAGVMWAVFFAVFALLYILPLAGSPRRLRTHVLGVLMVSSALACLFCYLQSVADILGVPRETTLLCLGCTYRSFGFPHPSGFAIEPQFMGNLLLAPTLTALYLMVFRSHHSVKTPSLVAKAAEHSVESAAARANKPTRWQRSALVVSAVFLSTTLFFTFSRGAIYAYAVALLVMLVFAVRRKTFRWSLLGIPVVSFLLALGLQGAFAAVGPTSETFTSAIAKSIHQLSLGIIDLRAQPEIKYDPFCDGLVENCDSVGGKLVENYPSEVENSTKDVEKSPEIAQNSSQTVENSAATVDNSAKTVQNSVDNHVENLVDNPATTSDNTPAEGTTFDGYVAESTNIRLRLSQVAAQTWLNAPGRWTISWGADCGQPYSELCQSITPVSILFGVGLGGAGTAMHAAYPEIVTSSKEIVQHQGFSLLLETGLVGVALAVFGLLVAFCPQLFSKKFIDGKAAGTGKASTDFWQHPALPLLVSLIVAYLITLNFFSGLPNALQIYLMPPLLYLVFRADDAP